MVEFYDPETKAAIKPRQKTKAEIARDNWDAIREELVNETEIPTISYCYFDNKNDFEVRLRGRADQYIRTEFGEMRLLKKGKFANLSKDFTFKGEGKSPYPRREEMERWSREVIKWFKSLDGQNELAAAEGIKHGTQTKKA